MLSAYGPIIGLFFYQKHIGVLLGSFVAGFVSRENGWLIGIIISIIHILYIYLLLLNPPLYLSELDTKVVWQILVLPSEIILFVGFIGGSLGSRVAAESVKENKI